MVRMDADLRLGAPNVFTRSLYCEGSSAPAESVM